jgi:hypothetical protein
MPKSPVRVNKAKFDALLGQMIKMPPLTLEDMKKEKRKRKSKSARRLRG